MLGCVCMCSGVHALGACGGDRLTFGILNCTLLHSLAGFLAVPGVCGLVSLASWLALSLHPEHWDSRWPTTPAQLLHGAAGSISGPRACITTTYPPVPRPALLRAA